MRYYRIPNLIFFMKYFILSITILILLSLLVVVTSCRTTRNASTVQQSDFVGVSHETDCSSDSATLTLQAQRTLTLSIDSLFFYLSPDGLMIEVAETARTGSWSGLDPQSRPGKAAVAAYGIRLGDSTAVDAHSKAVSDNRKSSNDSIHSSQQHEKVAKSDKTDLTTIIFLLLLIAIGIVAIRWTIKRF